MSDLIFKTTAKCETNMKTVVKARNFTIIIDEPESLGGSDHGANPVEYVQAALAGCLNVVGHIVAKEMGFEIKNMEIEIEGSLNPAKFVGKSSEERAGYKVLNVTLKVDTDADELTLKKWVETIETRCPVSDNITNQTEVNIKAQK